MRYYKCRKGRGFIEILVVIFFSCLFEDESITEDSQPQLEHWATASECGPKKQLPLTAKGQNSLMLTAFVQLISSISHSIFTLVYSEIPLSPWDTSCFSTWLMARKPSLRARLQLPLCLDGGGGFPPGAEVFIPILGGVHSGWSPPPKEVPFSWFTRAAVSPKYLPRHQWVFSLLFFPLKVVILWGQYLQVYKASEKMSHLEKSFWASYLGMESLRTCSLHI